MVDEDPPEASGRAEHGDVKLSEAETSQQADARMQLAEKASSEAIKAPVPPDPGTSSPGEAQEMETTGREPEPSESGEGASQRFGGPKRSEELLLKNRKAQRRFRERQKSKITELEEKNAELTAELKRLQQENQNLDSRMGALVRLLHQRNAQLDQARSQGGGAAMDEEVSTAFTDNLVLSWSEGQTFALTPDQVRELSKDDLIKIWKEYVQQLASNLGELDNQNPSTQPTALENIKRLTHELTMILLRVSICSPLVARNFAAYRLEDPQNAPEDNLESTWRSIVSSLMLSDSQRSELVQLRHLFLTKQAAIMDQRAEFLTALMETQQVPPQLARERVSSLQYLKAHEATNLMRQSIREEHALKLDFLSTVLKHLITPVQLTRCLVQSYPWFPDTLAMTTWLAAEAGDPQAMAFFGSGSSTGLSLPLSPRAMALPPGPFQLQMPSRGGGSGFSTPRNTTPTTPPRSTAGAPTPFHVGAGQPMSPGGPSGGWSLPGHQLVSQHSGHSGLSGVQYGLSPAQSPHYTPHRTPSPAPSPPLSPSGSLLPPQQHPGSRQQPQPPPKR